jgi:hypothetical protein
MLVSGTFTRPATFGRLPVWAHVRRKFYDIQAATGSPTAEEAIQRVGALYDIEREIRGKPIELRHQIRQTRARPAGRRTPSLDEQNPCQDFT